MNFELPNTISQMEELIASKNGGMRVSWEKMLVLDFNSPYESYISEGDVQINDITFNFMYPDSEPFVKLEVCENFCIHFTYLGGDLLNFAAYFSHSADFSLTAEEASVVATFVQSSEVKALILKLLVYLPNDGFNNHTVGSILSMSHRRRTDPREGP